MQNPPSHTELRRERLLLWTLAGVQFSHIVDFMIMMPLGPMLMEKLALNTHEFGLLVSSYTFTAAVSGILTATFIDRFERKRMLLSIFGLFTLATICCGLVNSYPALLITRSLAGAFGGILGAIVQTIVGDSVPIERRGSASGTIMSAFSLATVAGVPLSLLISNHFGWRAPFIFIGLISIILWLLGYFQLPILRNHLNKSNASKIEPNSWINSLTHPIKDVFSVLRDRNHFRALTFMGITVFSGFTIIPYITLYTTKNIGITQIDLPWIYLSGGAATFFTSRFLGRLADKYGKKKIYRIVACASLLPFFLQTHLPPVPLWCVLISSTLFFILVPGRMVPAMAIVTSAVTPHKRGTFLSINAAIQQLASGTASFIGGLIISQNINGQLIHYDWVGWLAIGMATLAIFAVNRVEIRS